MDSGTEPAAVTRRQFLKLPENRKLRGEIRTAGILCYICAAVTFASALLGSTGGIFDAILVLVLGLLIHLLSSRIASFLLTAYAAFNLVVMYLYTDTVSGWLILIAGILSVLCTCSAAARWKKYKRAEKL